MDERMSRILVVDDNRSNRYAVSRILRRAGYDVTEAETGKQALELIKQKPDLVILDIQLPDMNGFEICRMIKADEATARISVLHLSATYVEGVYRARGLDGGADSYLTHPVEPPVLLGTVNALLRLKRAEEVLSTSARQWRATFDAISDPIFLLDQEQRVLRCNRASTTLLGLSFQEILGGDFEALLHASLGLNAGQPGETLLGARTATTQKCGDRWFSLSSDPILDEQELVIGSVHILIDITKQMRREQSQRILAEAGARLVGSLEYEDTLERAAHVGCPELAQEDRLYIEEGKTPRLVRVHGSDCESPPAETSPALEAEWLHCANRVIRSGQPEVSKARFLPDPCTSSEGERSYMCVPLEARGQTFGALLMIAAPDRTFDQDDLELGKDLGRRAASAIDNARLYHSAQNAIQTRDAFLAAVSHDLRNPLTTVLMATTSLLRNNLPGPEGERTARVVERIQRSADQMEHLIRDLLDLASLEAGRLIMEPHPHPIDALIRDTIEQFQLLAERKSLRLEMARLPSPLEATFDRERILQVFSNLLGNSLKFTPAGGSIVIWVEKRSDELLFAVQDSGIGIPESRLPFLFDRYWQAPETARQGAGLGLSIAKGIVEAHGGRMWAESSVGVGSQFMFTLPLTGESCPLSSDGDKPVA